MLPFEITLKKTGTPIGPNDLLIAAHARAANSILVTANTSEFSRVPELNIENWLEINLGLQDYRHSEAGLWFRL